MGVWLVFFWKCPVISNLTKIWDKPATCSYHRVYHFHIFVDPVTSPVQDAEKNNTQTGLMGLP